MQCEGSGLSLAEMKETIRKYQRSRMLCLWHDHGTVLGSGIILVTAHVIYDPAVFMTTHEYNLTPGLKVHSVQTEVEMPEVHLIALGTSSAEDQAFLIADRVECLRELDQPIRTENGVEIQDSVRVFTGDHPAAQFERGTQQGGTYKCGSCGCKATMMDDQAHALYCHCRSLKEIQSIATAGVFGRQPIKVKPFDKLRVSELREELRKRGVLQLDGNKEELQEKLQDILKGVQRVLRQVEDWDLAWLRAPSCSNHKRLFI